MHTIAFCFNVQHADGAGYSNQLDFDSPEAIAAITRVIQELGYQVIPLEAGPDIFEQLQKHRDNIDLVFNIAEGLHGDARESWVPMICEQLQLPYTHSTPTVHALKMDKRLAKLAVAGLGIAVPGTTRFPKIIKPNAEGSSVGVFDGNVVADEATLQKQVDWLRNNGLNGELLIEEYIAGREFTVGLLGNGNKVEVLPIIEQNFSILPDGMHHIAGYELKWQIEDHLQQLTDAYVCPAKLDDAVSAEILATSKKIYTGLGVRDCARIDYRLDAQGRLFFIEINTLPGINPNRSVISYLPIAARSAGMEYQELLKRIIDEAKNRYAIH